MRIGDVRAVGRRCFVVCLIVVVGATPLMSPALAQDATSVIAANGQTVLLRDQPSFQATVLATLGEGSQVEVTGDAVTAADGSTWLPVVAGGQAGFVPAGYVSAGGSATEAPAPPASEPAAPAPAADFPIGSTATTTTDSNLRAGPSLDSAVLTVLPAGTVVSVDGAADGGFVPVTGNGTSGWIAAELLTTGGTLALPTSVPPPPNPSTPFRATASADLPLHTAPDPSSPVLVVIPRRTSLMTTGGPQNGFFPTEYGGQAGWVEGTFLTIGGNGSTTVIPASVSVTTPVPTAAPEPAAAPTAAPGATVTADAAEQPAAGSTGIAWPFAGGTWQVIQGYNNGTHTDRGGFAQYKYALDWARTEGETAGQPVFAPVSGTIRMVDRGSGGLLIDAGNGYGVALFHVTLDSGLASGSVVDRGQRIGAVSGPGGDGYMSTAHVEIDCWRLDGGSHTSVPCAGANAIGGQDFPDIGGTNQYMGTQVSP